MSANSDSGTLDSSIRAAAALLKRSHHAVALSGAGLSAESGIPTYRGANGLWTKFGEPTIDGWEMFCSDPREWWELALERREGTEFGRAIEVAEPNQGHVAMADLEAMGRLAHVVTQNIDNLHQLAGSRSVTEIHGNRAKVRCMNCGIRRLLVNTELGRLPPLCLDCGGVLKNDTVMFGEPIPDDALRECYKQSALADIFLAVGTSAVVYPAADLPVMAKRRGAPLIEVNPHETALSDIADVIVRASAGVALPAIVELLHEL
ncbi:MAG: NAD-dependent deacylase [Anaerolineaceae bacterium]